MKTPIQGSFTTSLIIGMFVAGYFAKTVPALFIILIPIGIVWLVAFVMAIQMAFSGE